MRKTIIVFVLMLALVFVLTACGSSGGDGTLLGEVEARGYLLVSTDPNYAPQSFLDPDAVRDPDTICADDHLTYGEMIGFDVDVAKEIADHLGVEVCFVTPDWDLLTAGSWGDRWDISVGSMTVYESRQLVLDFVTFYYNTPAQFAASADSGITSHADLEGETICVATATTYEEWLNGSTMGLPLDVFYMDVPSDIEIVTLPTDQECAQSIAAGRPEFSVYLTSGTVIDSNIANGLSVVKVGSPAFSENLSPAIDKSSSFDTATFLAAVDAAVVAMHADGTMSSLSIEWFDVDLTVDPTQ